MRIKSLVAVPAMLSLTLVAGCHSGSSSAGSTASSSSSSTGASDTATSATSTDTSASASTVSCPTSNTRSFAKTRFVTDIGLAAGTFHRYLWKPYQAGSFKKGANGRVKAIIKGGAIGALDLKLMSNAKKNVAANPTLCKVLYTPISDAVDQLGNVKSDITSGSSASLTSLESTFSKIEGGSKSNGVPITETTDESQASNG